VVPSRTARLLYGSFELRTLPTPSTLTLWNDDWLPTSTTVVRGFTYVHAGRHDGSHEPYDYRRH
jgi:hypothetical protein